MSDLMHDSHDPIDHSLTNELQTKAVPAGCIKRGVNFPARIVYAYGVDALQAIALAGSQAELGYMLVPMAVTNWNRAR